MKKVFKALLVFAMVLVMVTVATPAVHVNAAAKRYPYGDLTNIYCGASRTISIKADNFTKQIYFSTYPTNESHKVRIQLYVNGKLDQTLNAKVQRAPLTLNLWKKCNKVVITNTDDDIIHQLKYGVY